MTRHTLGGFILPISFRNGYAEEFCRNFPDLHCELDTCNLVLYWRQDNKPVSKAMQSRVEWWHHGYRSALCQWCAASYR